MALDTSGQIPARGLRDAGTSSAALGFDAANLGCSSANLGERDGWLLPLVVPMGRMDHRAPPQCSSTRSVAISSEVRGLTGCFCQSAGLIGEPPSVVAVTSTRRSAQTEH